MANFFEELGLLDRPFVTFEILIGSTLQKFQARSLSAYESDELEALQMDEYARNLNTLTESKPDAVSELERIRRVYSASSVEDLAKQLIVTRESDVTKRAAQALGINFREEAAKMEALPEEEREAYATEMNEKLTRESEIHRQAILKELETQPIDVLAKKLSEIAINIRAQRMAQRQFNDLYLFYTLYRPNADTRCFDKLEEVAKTFSAEKIELLVQAVREALRTDLPFGSPAADEPVKPPSSPSTSEEDTAVGGTPTETTNDA